MKTEENCPNSLDTSTKTDNNLNSLESSSSCSNQSRKSFSIVIPSRQYALSDQTKILNPAEDIQIEVPEKKTVSLPQSKNTKDMMIVLNLMDIDVNEVQTEVDQLSQFHAAQNHMNLLKKFMIDYKIDCDGYGSVFYQELEKFIDFINSHFIPTFRIKQGNQVANDINGNDITINPVRYALNANICAMLNDLLSECTCDRSVPEFLKLKDEKIKKWLGGSVVGFKELLGLKADFSFIDIRKLHESYIDNPGLVIKSIKSREFLNDFENYSKSILISAEDINSIWMDLPNDLDKICDIINTKRILFKEEFKSLYIALKKFKIIPFIGITWPYSITTLLLSSSSSASNPILKRRYYLEKPSSKKKYKVNFEDYHSQKQHIKAYVK